MAHTMTALTRPAPSQFNLQQALQRFERGYLQNMLQLAQGDLQEAARMMEISPEMLQMKVREYELFN